MNELFAFSESESLSEEGLREILERHEVTPSSKPDGADFFFCNMCMDGKVTEGIIQCLIEYFPDAIKSYDDYGGTVLHYACLNKSITRGMMQLLIDADPTNLRKGDTSDNTPLHTLCRVEQDAFIAMEILKLFLENYPEAARHATENGYRSLPIHFASESKSPEFCKVLIEAYPGSERIADDQGRLPLHYACAGGAVDAVEFLHKLYPDAINHADTSGCYPIHFAIQRLRHIGTLQTDLESLKYLLVCDPNVKLQKWHGCSLLHYACLYATIGEASVAIIYDAHPEAIEDDVIEEDFHDYDDQVQAFIRTERGYALQAKNLRFMMTPDEMGQLPLHVALQNNVRLGSIKLLVKGNPSALRNLDNNFALPLHIACEHHDSASVIQHLIDLDMRTLRAEDNDNNTVLHYACRGAKYDTIALLLKNYDAISVSKRNAQKKLPIDLLCESSAVEDRDSIEYTQSVFRLLRAYPEMTLMDSNSDM